ncbi:MAG: hypothetical protein U0T83_02225 [Bacteriovoracaceae bacterium]
MKKYFIKLLFPIITLSFLIRGILFVNNHGGIEYDSGWFMSVAQNLALYNEYSTNSNTTNSNNTISVDIWGTNYVVQDQNGHVYFPPNVSVGPAFLFPAAIILKIFGIGFWQYRVIPLLSYFFLILILLFICYQFGGLIAVGIFSVWFWGLIKLYTPLFYEAQGEPTAILYFFLAGYIFFYGKKNKLTIFSSGILAALSFLTKSLYLLLILSFFVILGLEVLKNFKVKDKLKTKSVNFAVFTLGFILPNFIFNTYRYYSLVTKFGEEAYKKLNEGMLQLYYTTGSGLGKLFDFNSVRAGFKINIWNIIGIEFPIIYLLLLLVIITFILIKKEFFDFDLKKLLAISVCIHLTWYYFICSDPFSRYAWPSVIISIIFISSYTANFLKKHLLPTIVVSILFIYFNFNSNAYDWKFKLEQEDVTNWIQDRYQGPQFKEIYWVPGYRTPTNNIYPLADQLSIAAFMRDFIKENDQVYYIYRFFSPEISLLVNKVFYPIERFVINGKIKPKGGKAYLISGVNTHGYKIYQAVPPYADKALVNSICKNINFQNDSYLLCEIKDL